jgi:uncharacterized membrane protein
MGKGRFEAFSDGVIAIIITIMVLEIKVPHGAELSDLKPLYPVFLSYVLSFTNIGIYWNNHHHMLQLVDHIRGRALWANLHLLFWLSLIPFTTGWMGENHFAVWPVAVYGLVLFMAGTAYYILVRALTHVPGENVALAAAIGKDWKGKLSVLVYAVAIGIAFVNAWISLLLIALVAATWFIPDTRVERKLGIDHGKSEIEG